MKETITLNEDQPVSSNRAGEWNHISEMVCSYFICANVTVSPRTHHTHPEVMGFFLKMHTTHLDSGGISPNIWNLLSLRTDLVHFCMLRRQEKYWSIKSLFLCLFKLVGDVMDMKLKKN